MFTAQLFQSTPLREGRHALKIEKYYVDGFQSTPPREGRRHGDGVVEAPYAVSIHAPARGATSTWSTSAPGWSTFQSTPLREGRQAVLKLMLTKREFQSTPLSEGRPGLSLPSGGPFAFQSTPLREGRPAEGESGPERLQVSIHAPARGATTRSSSVSPSHRSFNPRPCARGDSFRGAHMTCINQFQSTPLREGRLWDCATGAVDLEFQSTPLREGRRNRASNLRQSVTSFNPRPCARGDRGRPADLAASPVSIHAPARGATHERRIVFCRTILFQSTPLREGRRRERERAPSPQLVSIHAPARGATSPEREVGLDAHVSIHAPAATRRTPAGSGWCGSFNPRPCARGDPAGCHVGEGLKMFQSTPLREGRPAAAAL